jgi:hypothetical protein
MLIFAVPKVGTFIQSFSEVVVSTVLGVISKEFVRTSESPNSAYREHPNRDLSDTSKGPRPVQQKIRKEDHNRSADLNQ